MDVPALKPRRLMIEAVLSLLEKSSGPLSVQEIIAKTQYSKGSIVTTLYMLQKITGSVKLVSHDDQKTKDVDSVYRYPSVNKWLSELKKGDYVRGSKYTFFDFIVYFREHSEYKDPEQLIEDALNASPRELQKHVSLIKDYIADTQKNVLISTKQKRKNVLCSFYLHNGVTLPRFSLPKEAASDTEVETRDPFADSMMVMLRKVLLSGKISTRDKAVILVACQGGMDDSTLAKSFNFVGYAQLCAHFGTRNWREWDSSKVPVRLNLVRPKTGKAFYTFIDRDAVEALKEWLAVRFKLIGKEIEIKESRRSDRVPLSDPIFIVAKRIIGRPLRAAYVSEIFRTAGFVAGVNVKQYEKIEKWKGSTIRYPFHSHEVRDMLKTLGHNLGLKDECEFFLGHEIDKLKYDKHPFDYPDYWRNLYSKMALFLNVVSNDPEKAGLTQKLEQTQEEKAKVESQLYIKNKMLEERVVELEADNKKNSVNPLVLAQIQKLLQHPGVRAALDKIELDNSKANA
jgi:hypothetical protein